MISLRPFMNSERVLQSESIGYARSIFCRIACIPSILGEARLLHRTVAWERRKGGARTSLLFP